MSSFNVSMDRDANRVPLTGDFPFRTKRTLTFDGGTTNGWGDDGGTLDGGAVYTVTGLVEVKLYGECTTDLVGGATVEVGVTGATAIYCSQITDTVLDAGEIYIHDTSPASHMLVGTEEQAAADNLPTYALNGTDIILTTTTTNTTSGVIDFFALWKPISDDGSVVITTT